MLFDRAFAKDKKKEITLSKLLSIPKHLKKLVE